MGVIETRTFKSGNSVALRLPKELGIPANMPVVLERDGDTITIRPADDPEEGKRRLAAMIAELRAIGPIEPVGQREPIEFPDRPGLY